jgi:aminopeptidase N
MIQASGRPRPILTMAWVALGLSLALLAPMIGRADEPYAPSRDYDLQNVRTHLWFDVEHKSVRGEVTHSISVLRNDITQIKFSSVDLNIESVTVDGKEAKFATDPDNLIISLTHPAKRGDKHEIFVRYAGRPKKGLYFVLPDKDYPDRPKEIWTQGESEDTRYYIPIYDYPNDRTTSEMLLTVPATWLTVSNGQLVGIKSEDDGTKTWDWKQSEPLSTYLISAVAGEFVEKKDTWRGVTLRYVVPRGEEYKIDSTFSRTKQMLDAFSDRLDVKYPWVQYAQTSVDDFVVGGMENTSATTLTTSGLVNPKLAGEELEGSDDLNSHELAHQWFGDLVTCKDWANIWLNEGFATYFEHYWLEAHYGVDEAAYEFWRDENRWMSQKRLFSVPIVTHETDDMVGYSGNIYTKGGLILKMLRSQIGDENFFHGLHNYLQINRGKNVVTADLQKAIEEVTATNVDKFFQQWVYRAGAPKFDVSYTYDDAGHQAKLHVKQTQKVEGMVSIFDVWLDVEIATAGGRKSYPIEVSKADETFVFPVDGAPLMVVFDKGDRILKSVEFKKDPALSTYQLKNAEAMTDRADAAVALGDVKDNADAVAALGEAAQHDPFWGVRAEALKALGKNGGASAEKQVLGAINDEKPWVRDVAVEQLGNFKDDALLGPKLTDLAANDKAYRVRAAAMAALAQLKTPNALDTLAAAAKSDSPDDTIRTAALRALGTLGDDRAVPLLLEWAGPGKPLDSRSAAIGAVASLDKNNHELTKTISSYLRESHSRVRFSTIIALGRRGDLEAIGPLEDLIKSGALSIGLTPFVQGQISALRAQASGKPAAGAANPHEVRAAQAEGAGNGQDVVLENLKRLQQQMDEVNTRLTKIESQLGSAKK